MKGIKIRVTHRGERQPKFKIERLSSKAADYLTFRNEKEGKDVSVVDYFVQQYNRQLEFRCLPCIVVRKSMFFPIELCEVLPGILRSELKFPFFFLLNKDILFLFLSSVSKDKNSINPLTINSRLI